MGISFLPEQQKCSPTLTRLFLFQFLLCTHSINMLYLQLPAGKGKTEGKGTPGRLIFPCPLAPHPAHEVGRYRKGNTKAPQLSVSRMPWPSLCIGREFWSKWKAWPFRAVHVPTDRPRPGLHLQNPRSKTRLLSTSRWQPRALNQAWEPAVRGPWVTAQMPMAGPCGKNNGICPGRDGERASQAGGRSGFGKDAKVAILLVGGERREERGLGAGLHA